MAEKVLMKGNEALAEAAIQAGCHHFFGYPITPQTELAAYMAKRMPKIGGTYLQAESEIAAVNMVLGAAAAGVRAMTSSSSPGISLKGEGISYMAGSDLPALIINVQRGGPGLGGIQPSQSDYWQATKALGHGDFQILVFAPSTVQEMVDLVSDAFDKADEYRMPAMILADGMLGQMMEPVELPEMRSDEEIKRLKDELSDWALVGHSADKKALILPGGWAGQEDRCKANAAMYDTWVKDVQVEEFMTEDAELILVAYGVCGRISKSAVRILRTQGYKVGLIRPKTVSPWPYASFDKLDYSKVKAVLDIEMSIPAQLVLDVTLAVKDRCPVHTCLRSGGEIMSRDHVVAAAKAILDKEGA